ncbi:hypothetical protein [Agromyces sp. Marseille-P2726]|uniref:hypothetical protein n=1 Tax=Agromyces sp. Marseille-P2726 TaxID=2709132 RepID=UPI00156E0F6A|nr:hypothetical protein [Agromyces sp. Marseille-P2726]
MTPVIIEYPDRDTYGDVMKGYFSLMRGFGLELAHRADEQLIPEFGPGWFGHWVRVLKTRGKAKGRVALNDPSFFLGELVWTTDSPLRLVFPFHEHRFGLAKRILDTRNTWLHFSADPTLSQLEEAANLVRRFGEGTGLQISVPAARLIKRITRIRTGQHVPPAYGRAPIAPMAQADPDVAAELSPRDVPNDDAEAAIELAPVAGSRPPIGGRWIGEVPQRKLRVTKTRDVIDLATGRTVRDEVEGDLREKVRQWTSPSPLGDLSVAEDGAVVGFVAGVARLLGYTGVDPENEEARGFLLPHFYDFVGGHLVDLDSGIRLADAAADSAPAVDSALEGIAHEGGTIRLTTFGDLIYLDDQGLRRVATVTPSGWFPGHFDL